MNVLTEEEINSGYRLLFDGETLNGWAATKHPDGWLVQGGNIVCKGESNGYLYTVDQFENFIIHLEYKAASKTNSGIFFRWSDLQDPVNTGLEMQILDTYDQEKMSRNSSGALYDLVAPSSNTVRQAGEWNQIRITCDNNQIELMLNGVVVVEADIDQWSVAGKNPDGTDNKFKYAWRDLPRSGHIGLQDHGGYVEFRNIKMISL
ncbi:DUF1080 domain-containing protein [Paenibacillus sp. NPDC056579]|uniref:3-keto-disaccharide hydrolase n=1 Tax=unclassified Paenibacillus TaxID=185978 RepID=UPI001EF81863|nr:DUF1080 domain-containing protein [Paenibacillus sp. H1-7]ULL16835.1 DUF1080 domain-containing protein [Paenibacillus sp. H1-7]